MSEQRYSVLEAFEPAERTAQSELDAYFASRPFKDSKGLVRAPDGTFANADTFFNNRRDEIDLETAKSYETYESMTLPTLARTLAQAEVADDKTSVLDITNVLLDKMAAQDDLFRSLRDTEHNNNRSDNIWDRVMGIKNSEHDRLTKELIVEVKAEQAATAAVAVNELEAPQSWYPATPEAREKYSFEVGHAQKTEYGEDRVVIDSEIGFFAVVDGMGGHVDGAIAAEIVGKQFFEFWLQKHKDVVINETNAVSLMKASIMSAQKGLDDAARAGQGHEDMGAVATQIKFFKDSDGKLRLVYGHVGDTRLYLQEGVGDEIRQITQDENAPGRPNEVTNAFLAGQPGRGAKAQQIGISRPLTPGARVMLCTDGITGDTEVQQIAPKNMIEAFDMQHIQSAAESLVGFSTKKDDGNIIMIEVMAESALATPTPNADVEPPKVQPKSPQQRARAFMAGVFKNATEKKSRNKTFAVLVAGALALGSLSLFDSGSNGDKDARTRLRATPTVAATPNATPVPSIRPTAIATPFESQPTKATVKLSHGDTIWNEAATKLKQGGNSSPTDLQILNETSRVLKLNNLSWDQARHLADDTEITE